MNRCWFTSFFLGPFVSDDFEKHIVTTFERLDLEKFRVNNSSRHLFVCGGLVDVSSPIPPSFRDRFIGYTAENHETIHDSVILAEAFLDYFKENAYRDLFVFEEEIAKISSLVIIFLESPGSLVELGIFCAIPDITKKLLIVAPQEHVQGEDSFIYLGPLSYLKRLDDSSLTVYPWPDNALLEYDDDHLIGLCDDVQQKILKVPKTSKFNQENSGHVALLVAEIIRVCYPIQITEISNSLDALGFASSIKNIHRSIYLLKILKFVESIPYGGNTYYYPYDKRECTVSFSESKVFEASSFRINLNQSYKHQEDSQSRKRRTALKMIQKLDKGEVS